MRIGERRQRVLAFAVAIAMLASLALVASSGLATVDQEILTNGNFEGGFNFVSGCGMVGARWGCFSNGGSAAYGFYDETWAPTVADGSHSQLIEISTLQVAASENDRYAGIYQTVNVVTNGTYQLQLQGMLRERNPSPQEDKWRYRAQWGYTVDGSTDWQNVTNWVELPWDNVYDRLSPGYMQSFSTSFVAPSNRITLFFRLWKKWGTPSREVLLDLDAISMFGPGGSPAVVVLPSTLPPTGSGSVIIIPSAQGAYSSLVFPTMNGVRVWPTAPSNGVIVIPPGAMAAVAPVQSAAVQPATIVISQPAVTAAAQMASACNGYTVRRGDTLAKIASRYHVTVSALKQRNRIPNANQIYSGQKLCIPN